MSTRVGQRIPARRSEVAVAFIFGCAAMVAVLWLAFRGGNLTDQQFEMLRIVLALAGGGVGAIIPGFLDLNMKAANKLALRAGGALAVFVVLYFWSPAHWAPSSSETVIQHTSGSDSPAQNGSGNIVIHTGASPR
jgi:hypothetical protein